MKLRFKKQAFQTDAVNAVCDCFVGQAKQAREYSLDIGTDIGKTLFNQSGFGNSQIKLSYDDLLQNIREVQKRQDLLPCQTLQKLNGRPCFSIEMETGTGKTYTYIKTMYELYERYGFSKFIIVVPSIAIREGVLKSFDITQEHFSGDYGKKCRFFVYNSARLNELDQFAGDAGINAMIINTQAFNAAGKDARRIDMVLDTFRGRKPIDVIAAANPIVIIDEPQSVIGTDKKANATRESIRKFNPLFFINYSATHRENFNMIYRLDAIDAYQKQLVKRISVKGISVLGSAATTGYLYLQKINVFPNKNPSATVVFEYNSKTARGISKKVKTLELNDNIYTHSGEIESYKNGFVISNINANTGEVEFASGLKIAVGQCVGEVNDGDLRRIQIRETIISHLEKERELFKKGIKVLSLFFIDEVAKYKDYSQTDEKGLYSHIFEAEYKAQAEHFLTEVLPFNEDKEFREYLKRDIGQIAKIHAGYFSIDKKGRAVDSQVKRGEQDSDDTSAYDLIMKDKERLLSFDEPVRFIFSHSALREGWDNPNVFQICTLRQSSSEIKKRQEVGRGLRLCVNKDGERQDTEVLGLEGVHSVNALTVIANESYEDFAKGLQDELYEAIKNRPKEITPELFARTIVSADGKENIFNSTDAARLFIALETEKIVQDGQLTQAYLAKSEADRQTALENAVGAANKPFISNIAKLLESVYNPKIKLVEDGRKKVNLTLDAEKFASREFKDLWKKINSQTYYTVSFDEQELIKLCIDSLNKNLRVAKVKAQITTGDLSVRQESVEYKDIKKKQTDIKEIITSAKFDLIGKITSQTGLLRKTIGKILQGIEKNIFEQFKANPETFIAGCVKLIDEQKATTIIEHITYNKLDKEWKAEEIFADANISGQYGQNVRDARKHLYDRLRYDSEVENKLSQDLDAQEQVKLYVKLPSGPRGFYIHTPLGKYNPDWAIVLNEAASGIRHIYFVAESKSSSLDIQLREVEKAKIECARKHFKAISNGEVKYDVINNFEDLLRKLTAV